MACEAGLDHRPIVFLMFCLVLSMTFTTSWLEPIQGFQHKEYRKSPNAYALRGVADPLLHIWTLKTVKNISKNQNLKPAPSFECNKSLVSLIMYDHIQDKVLQLVWFCGPVHQNLPGYMWEHLRVGYRVVLHDRATQFYTATARPLHPKPLAQIRNTVSCKCCCWLATLTLGLPTCFALTL